MQGYHVSGIRENVCLGIHVSGLELEIQLKESRIPLIIAIGNKKCGILCLKSGIHIVESRI